MGHVFHIFFTFVHICSPFLTRKVRVTSDMGYMIAGLVSSFCQELESEMAARICLLLDGNEQTKATGHSRHQKVVPWDRMGAGIGNYARTPGAAVRGARKSRGRVG